MTYGYIQDDIRPEDYVFGKSTVSKDILAPGGRWDAYLPLPEYQSKPTVETSACVTFGTYNVLEAILKRKYKVDANFSERYGAKLTGTTQQGNSPQKVAEYTRKYIGAISEGMLPFDDTVTTWDMFYSGVNFSHWINGIQWILRWKMNHEWVDGSAEAMKDALTLSPLGVAVHAWRKQYGLYVREGGDNHWCVIYGYKNDKYWEVYDSYDNTNKRLEWKYGFSRVKRYHLEPREGIDPKTLGRAILGVRTLL